jgi:hypothetical protein
MKTIEEAALDYAGIKIILNEFNPAQDFIAGVEFAQRWTPVEEDLPENIDNVLIKILCEPHPPTKAAQPLQKEPFTMVTLGYYYKNFNGSWHIIHNLIESKFHCKSWQVTHWRKIELR